MIVQPVIGIYNHSRKREPVMSGLRSVAVAPLAQIYVMPFKVVKMTVQKDRSIKQKVREENKLTHLVWPHQPENPPGRFRAWRISQ